MKKFYEQPEFITLDLNTKDIINASDNTPGGYSVYSENGGAGDGSFDSFVFPL